MPNKFYKNSKFTTQRLKITAIWRICKICWGITCKWRQELFIDQSIKAYKEVWIFWMNNMAFVSPHIPESWFRNLLNFCLHVESGIPGFEIWNTAQGIRNLKAIFGIRKLSSTEKTPEASTWNPDSTAWNPESKCFLLDSLSTWGSSCDTKN